MPRPASSADTVVPGSVAEEHVLDETGHFNAKDAPIDFSHYTLEAWVSFGFFWLLALTVFYQFFTRYVLNDSAGWTEEIARYLLICTVFIAISAGVRTDRHIHVDLAYRLVPSAVGRVLSTFVDVVKVVFFAYAAVLTWQLMDKMGNYKMTIIDLPMNLVYGVCGVGFALSAVRALQVGVENWRRGYSLLERPEIAIEETV